MKKILVCAALAFAAMTPTLAEARPNVSYHYHNRHHSITIDRSPHWHHQRQYQRRHWQPPMRRYQPRMVPVYCHDRWNRVYVCGWTETWR